MKIAISLPDELFSDAEEMAKRLKRSRSRLYADAMREYLARHDPDAITDALNHVCDTVDERADPAILNASRRILRRVEW